MAKSRSYSTLILFFLERIIRNDLIANNLFDDEIAYTRSDDAVFFQWIRYGIFYNIVLEEYDLLRLARVVASMIQSTRNGRPLFLLNYFDQDGWLELSLADPDPDVIMDRLVQDFPGRVLAATAGRRLGLYLWRAIGGKISVFASANIIYACLRPSISSEGIVIKKEFRSWEEFEEFIKETNEFPYKKIAESQEYMLLPRRLVAFYLALKYNNFSDVIHRVDVSGVTKSGWKNEHKPLVLASYLYDKPDRKGRRFHSAKTMLVFIQALRSSDAPRCGVKDNLPLIKESFDKYGDGRIESEKTWKAPVISVEYRPGLTFKTIWIAAAKDIIDRGSM